ncbi:MAG: NAD-dependent epimerase/dehydratase family protein [Alphaproteobacteria bacterium]|nr:NAD-dependent epimerase/dehydratase family protein [Alphaproteobacteria bacterium]
MKAPVLVTGGSGFVGVHAIAALLNDGHRVRTTVRNVMKEEEIRAMLGRAGVDAGDRLTVVAADLTSDEGWDRAVEGCAYVHHVASPFPAAVPSHEDELIVPAREGTLRVLRAARAAGVKRVVVTSSFAAIGYGGGEPPPVFDETCWSDPDGDIAPYAKSKTVAERAAWDFVADGGPELAVVNPVGIFGPVLGGRPSTSIELVKRVIRGMPGCPRLWFGVVDVRDVVDLHLRAMSHPDAAGERFLAVSGDFLTVQQIATILKEHLGDRGSRIRTRQIPDFVVRLVALWDPAVRLTLTELGREKHGTGAKAERMLGWSPRTPAEALGATADSLIELGMV